MQWTTADITALAPDDSSLKAARGLTSKSKWQNLGQDTRAAWGECQGSGAKPYQTQVDFAGPAFRCSCPSRKFPCKHGLALLLLRADQGDAFATSAAPAWVDEWLQSREAKAQKKEEKQIEKAATAADPAVKAKRENERWQRIETAANDLRSWLADQIQQGLANRHSNTAQQWQSAAARLVDAQAPGLAQRLHDCAVAIERSRDTPELALAQMGLLQLACDGLIRREALPIERQHDLRTVVGWPFDKTEVMAHDDTVTDTWWVTGVAIEEGDRRLFERRVWLFGTHSQRRALLLDHSHGNRQFEHPLATNQLFDASIHYYPASDALRSLLIKYQNNDNAQLNLAFTVKDEFERIAQRAATTPWTPLHPMMLNHAILQVSDDAKPTLVVEQYVFALHLPDHELWLLHAICGGHPVQVMGEWDGQHLRPLTAWRQSDVREVIWRKDNA